MSKSKKNKIVLVVEDDSILRPLLVELLTEMQFNIMVAEDGDSAYALMKELQGKKESIDLLLTDIGLPGMNGRDLAALARAIWPSLSILFITGYAYGVGELPVDNNIKLITKPFSLGTFTERVEELIA